LQTYLIKYAEITQPGKGYGVRGQSELKLNEATVIATAVAPIVAESRTFQDADVCFIVTAFCFILIRFQESPASVAVHITVDHIREDHYVLQCNDCKRTTLNDVCHFDLF
jgi:hypothetical protein